MERGKFILSIKEPWIDSYTTYAHLLSILQTDKRTTEWIFSNLLQMYMNKDLLSNSWGEFYKPLPYELSLFEVCKWIDIQKVRREDITISPEKCLQYFCDELSKGYYLHLIIEHKRIKSIETNNHSHDALVYGIDICNNEVYVQDVFINGKLERKIIPLNEFLDSVMLCKINPAGDYMKGSIYSYKIKEECDYEFAPENIWNSLKEYYAAKTPEYWRLFNHANAKYMTFGIDIYDALIEYLDKIDFSVNHLDVRPFYVMKDHSTIVALTMKFLWENYFDDNFDYEKIIVIYEREIGRAHV